MTHFWLLKMVLVIVHNKYHMVRKTTSSAIPFALVTGVIILIVTIIGYFYISFHTVNSGQKKTGSIVRQPSGQVENISSPSAMPSVSESDSTESIEEDLNSTEITDDPSIYSEVETGVSGL